MVKIYQKAPEFTAQAYFKGEIKNVSLKDYKGKWVVLFFYPLDFTFVCPTEIQQFSEHYDAFKKIGCEVIGGSVDSPYSHQAWSKGDLGEQKFPLISDLNHAVSTAYGCYLEDKGVTLRSTYIIDPEGNLQYMQLNPLNVGRNAEEILRTVEALQTGELCQASWKKGEKTLSQKLAGK
jgi:peroxiredoxin (alkyl hydroperoxide reductase subunit C)